MTPYERLMAEAIPTRPPAPEPGAAWTPEEQAEHVADLLNALNGWTYNRSTRPRLHLVDHQPHTDTAAA